jgi:hypothetical protein
MTLSVPFLLILFSILTMVYAKEVKEEKVMEGTNRQTTKGWKE